MDDTELYEFYLQQQRYRWKCEDFKAEVEHFFENRQL